MGHITNTKAEANTEARRRGIKRNIKARILEVLGTGPMTRDDIAERGELRLASVCAAANALVREGVLRVKDTIRSAETGMKRERLEVAQ
ncbi:hypothetical protein HOR55_gp36 [Ralstonia phage RS-PII-1]|uniref:Uncharacterized protein n=1 Tax=Ralstonia phage RS-PII-1 TaxID=1932892 RepID=A0A1L7DQK0_9CAUD|nr:hypothetical protein HOR55_gp36 [Ralstonia phage RS-PII-1]APU00323.1 hypothetical protein [Ralstonia phage RS-PII-1]